MENLRKSKGLAGSVSFGNQIGILDHRTSLAHCIVIGHGEFKTLDSGKILKKVVEAGDFIRRELNF